MNLNTLGFRAFWIIHVMCFLFWHTEAISIHFFYALTFYDALSTWVMLSHVGSPSIFMVVEWCWMWSLHSWQFLHSLETVDLRASRHRSPLPAYDSIDWEAPDTSAIRACAWVKVLKVQGMNVEKPFKRLKQESGQENIVVARSNLF